MCQFRIRCDGLSGFLEEGKLDYLLSFEIKRLKMRAFKGTIRTDDPNIGEKNHFAVASDILAVLLRM